MEVVFNLKFTHLFVCDYSWGKIDDLNNGRKEIILHFNMETIMVLGIFEGSRNNIAVLLFQSSENCLVVDVLEFDAACLVNFRGGDLVEGDGDLG